MRWRNHLTNLAGATIVSALFLIPALDSIDGLGIDCLFWLRNTLFGNRHSPNNSPTAVIAIDEETYQQSPFKGTPLALWTPYLARLLNNLIDVDAKVIGFDVIFSTSAQKFIPGFDREFLIAQRRAASEGKLVLAKTQHSQKPIVPFAGYGFAAGGGSNIKAANLFTDRDDVVRRAPLFLRGIDSTGNARSETSFALEIASRAARKEAVIHNNKVRLGSWTIPGHVDSGALINFDGGYPIPTYSLADVFACVMAEKQDFLKSHFSGKVVLIGAVLDVEDRKLTSQRFIVEPEGPYASDRCLLPPMPDIRRVDFVRQQIPGIYIHAQAINDFIRSETLFGAGRLPAGIIVFLGSLAAGFAAFSYSPLRVAVAILIASTVWVLVDTFAFQHGLVLPLLDPILGSVVAAVLLIAYRIAVTDKSKRQLRHAFGFYLHGTVIDRLLETDTLPVLGGEEREITIWFSDLAGFTRASEHQTAQDVVRRLNMYFSTMVDLIEAHGGFVDKFIGDGIVAIFGAPLVQPDHASAALAAAQACPLRLAGLAPSGDFKTRIGIHTGSAVIGNIGSVRRFNYTAIGDTVNLAARLESANKSLGTSVLVSETTWQNAGSPASLRRIGRIRVVGREEPLTVYSFPPNNAGQNCSEQFNNALRLAESSRFKESLGIFMELAAGDEAAAVWAQRLRTYLNEPPRNWDGAVELSEK